MKKFFSLIGLVGVFAACQPENLTTAFQLKPAELTLRGEAHFVPDGVNVLDSDVDYRYSINGAAFQSGKYCVLSGSPISEGNVEFSAMYEGLEGSTTVNYPTLYPGWGAKEWIVPIAVPFNAKDYTFVAKLNKAETDALVPEYKVTMLKAAAHNHGVVGSYNFYFDGEKYVIPMLANANDFILLDTFTYDSYDGIEAEGVKLENTDYEDEFNAVVKQYCTGLTVEEAKEGNITVSAWAMYNHVAVVKTTKKVFDVYAIPTDETTHALPNEGLIGSFRAVEMRTFCGPVEAALPGHESHYQHGHGNGHGHGENSNAGGGLIEAE